MMAKTLTCRIVVVACWKHLKALGLEDRSVSNDFRFRGPIFCTRKSDVPGHLRSLAAMNEGDQVKSCVKEGHCFP